MATVPTRTAVDSVLRLDHQLIIGHLYALKDDTSAYECDAVEISTDPATLVGGSGLDNKIEVIKSRGGNYADMMIGILANRRLADDINRNVEVVTHGVILGKNSSSENTIRAACLFQSASNGAITEATAYENVRGKTYEPIEPLKYGTVFVF
ncbi:hypothetical protein DRH29_02745 [candidate division Kazan bacterium]|uniref:Uncharacterized protein n=1 Tax=candidate division Kazan bacterium TaxID=2202143 RepID=A0A420ZCN8_UNCK3|nr:MAG: hypothetical protein DRH29_02745 [candidate division Kazan bacterium]